MKIIVVKTQEELDALPDKFDEHTSIEIRSDAEIWLTVSKAWGSSHVVARGSSHVVAWGSSHVEAWESSHVVALGSSHVVARGSSHVEAWGSVAVHCQSPAVSVVLWMFAVCWLVAKGKVVKKARTAGIIEPVNEKGVNAWLMRHGINPAAKVVLFKRVSKNYQTQEGQPWVTTWTPGTVVEHPNYKPDQAECGGGKFHFCPRPYFCDEFRSNNDDKYIAVEVAKKDLFVWDDNPDYPNKIAGRKAKVLHECDSVGMRIK